MRVLFRSPVARATAGALVTVVLVAGCGSSDQGSSANSSSAIRDVKVVDDLAAKVPVDIKQRGTLIAAAEADYAPFDFYTADDPNTIVGVDADIAAAIAQVLGLRPKMVNTSFDTIVPGIQAGKYDLGMSVHDETEEREQSVDMVDYLHGGISLIVAADGGQDFNGLADLCGKKAGIAKGETYATILDEQSKKCSDAGKPAIAVSIYPTADAVILALDTNRIDVTLGDTAVAVYKANNAAKGKIRVVGEQFEDHTQGIVIKKGAELAPVAADALNHLIQDGTYDKILTKWNLRSIGVDESGINGVAQK